MDRLVQALVAWGVLSAAGAWAWWVSEHRVNEVVGGVVLIVVLVGAFRGGPGNLDNRISGIAA